MSLQKYTPTVSGTSAGAGAGAGAGRASNNESVPTGGHETRGLCLLSLDGGGVKGLSTLYLLRAIMQLLNDKRKARHLDRVKPCEIFDLIGGTSTGGLIAIMLGRLEMDVDECITEYKNLMCTIFDEKKKSLFPLIGKFMINSRFSSKVLEEVIKQVITNVNKARANSPNKSPIPIDELFCLEDQPGSSQRCRVFVCAQSEEIGKITRLKSYRLDGDIRGEATIWQAALATTAATSFFDAAKIGDRTYRDGALGANNPAKEVENEAARIWHDTSGELQSHVKCFLSLGTGQTGTYRVHDRAWKFLSESLKNVATDTEPTNEEVAARWNHLPNKPYVRFNVQHGLEDIELAEYKREERGTMDAATHAYLDLGETRPRILVSEPNSTEPPEPTTSRNRETQQAPDVINRQELIQLTSKANACLEKSCTADAYKKLIEALSIFEKILCSQRKQQPPAEPRDLCYTYNKLRSTSHRLSHLDFPASQRMKYIDRATQYGEHAIKFAIASKNDNRVAQMQFYHACVQAQKIQLRTVEGQRFQAPMEHERHAAAEAIMMYWTTLQSIEGSDMTSYELMKAQSLGALT
ncbi:hypothetical protein LTR97_011157 [Elasticomyces elasticus]|uniref:PNPLA domain-containing protein n=1 Tax=Elasticomyces elasticus TaxID=574655 RepID=A0AAN7VZD5_9PEZI|nr:hypothetical protein LTR97_011157 [Elasticomyces elasticus]